MQSWNLLEIETPGGSRSPVVLHSDNEARAVLIGLDPGQELGDHQVKEYAFLIVVDGEVRVAAGTEQKVENLNIDLSLDSLTGPIVLVGHS